MNRRARVKGANDSSPSSPNLRSADNGARLTYDHNITLSSPTALLNSRVYAAIPFFFALILLLSGVYEIPFVSVDVPLVAKGKQVLFVCFMVLMGGFLRWREAMRSWFTLFCGIWALLHIGHWVFRAGYGDIYFHRLIQIAFIWVFVNFVVQRKEGSAPFFAIRTYFSPALFSAACLLLALFVFHPGLVRAITGGLGGNRFGFSIWLSQFVFLTFLVSMGKPGQSSLSVFAWATPIVVLQVFTGGRAGLLASLAIWLYFAHRLGGVRMLTMNVAYLAMLITLSAAALTLSYINTDETIFRVTKIVPDVVYMFAGSDTLSWLDRLSSYRIGILASVITTLDADSILLGKGVGNFQGHVPWGMSEVHNIFLRALGELGVIGLGTMVALLALPYYKQAQNADIAATRFFCGIFILVGMLHSEFLTTAISTCMVFWLGYAELLRGQESGAR